MGRLTSNAIIASLGKALGAGTLVSIIMVMTVLPQILLVFDKVIDRTEFNRGAVKKETEEADDVPGARTAAEAADVPESGAAAEAADVPESGAAAEAADAPESGAVAEAADVPESGAAAEAADAPESGAVAEAGRGCP